MRLHNLEGVVDDGVAHGEFGTLRLTLDTRHQNLRHRDAVNVHVQDNPTAGDVLPCVEDADAAADFGVFCLVISVPFVWS